MVGTGRGMTSAAYCMVTLWGGEAVEAVMLAEVQVGKVWVVRTNPATVCMLMWSVVVEGVVPPISGCCPAVVFPAMVWLVMGSWLLPLLA